jgi:hypothetical protein
MPVAEARHHSVRQRQATVALTEFEEGYGVYGQGRQGALGHGGSGKPGGSHSEALQRHERPVAPMRQAFKWQRGRRHAGSALSWTLICALLVVPQAGSAQGWRDRIKKAVLTATGLGGLVDMRDAVRAMQGASEATRHPSLLAGTYRLTYVYNGADSVVYFVRTFARPDIGMVGSTPAGMGPGYLLTTVAAASRDALPARWQDAREAMSHLGGGPMLVYPFAADADSTHAFLVNWQVSLAAEDQSAMWRDRVQGMYDKGELVDARDTPLPRLEQIQRGSANAILTRDGSVRMESRIKRDHDVLVQRAERMSDEQYSNDGKPAVPGIAP